MDKLVFPALRVSIYISTLVILFSCGESNNSLTQQANQEWVEGNNHIALELLNEVLKNNPEGKKAEEALFRIGEIYYFSLNNSARALVFFREVLQMNRDGPFGYKAQKYIAEIAEFGLKDYDQAIIEYQKLINFPKKELSRGEYQFRIASIYYKKENYYQALVEFEALLENYPKSSWVEETKFKIVEILYTLNRCPEVREQYRRFNLEYSNSRFKSEMNFVVASCLEEEGHLQDAYNLFKSLEGEYAYPSILKMKLVGIEKRIEKKR